MLHTSEVNSAQESLYPTGLFIILFSIVVIVAVILHFHLVQDQPENGIIFKKLHALQNIFPGSPARFHHQKDSTARDLLKLLEAARAEPRVHAFTTTGELWVTDLATGRAIEFFNTNRLVRNDGWDIHLSKTGYTADAGNCLVMQTTVGDRPLAIVLLNSWGKLSKYADATRIRDWLLRTERRVPLTTASI